MWALVTKAKEKLVNVRLTPATHEDFKVACELRGASMSSLLHQFIVRTIREEKERDPRAFEPRTIVDMGVSATAQLEVQPALTPAKGVTARKLPHLGEINDVIKPQRKRKAS